MGYNVRQLPFGRVSSMFAGGVREQRLGLLGCIGSTGACSGTGQTKLSQAVLVLLLNSCMFVLIKLFTIIASFQICNHMCVARKVIPAFTMQSCPLFMYVLYLMPYIILLYSYLCNNRWGGCDVIKMAA